MKSLHVGDIRSTEDAITLAEWLALEDGRGGRSESRLLRRLGQRVRRSEPMLCARAHGRRARARARTCRRLGVRLAHGIRALELRVRVDGAAGVRVRHGGGDRRRRVQRVEHRHEVLLPLGHVTEVGLL
jgi:hypothetical protein